MHTIFWNAPEYIHTEKTNDWYWIVGIITVSLVLISIIFNNLIFAILILVSSGTLTLYATRRPNIIPIEITDTGISISTLYHPYAELESFWIETRDRYPRIILKSNKRLTLYIVVLIENADPQEIHSLLSQHINEERHTEPLLEKLLIYLGF